MWITGKEGFEEDLWCTSLEWTRWWCKELSAKSVFLTMATCTAYFMSSYWKLWDLNPGSHDDEWHEGFVDPFCIWSSWVHKDNINDRQLADIQKQKLQPLSTWLHYTLFQLLLYLLQLLYPSNTRNSKVIHICDKIIPVLRIKNSKQCD